ncbi:MAG: hypothetical protein PHW34_02940 [Hespellia sp.]|nr:hypothetical protein [Hespellia sp.]
MKKIKRILAITGVVILVGLYVSTLVFALIGSELSTNLLKASVACTILLPIILYGYMLLYKLSKKNEENKDASDK